MLVGDPRLIEPSLRQFVIRRFGQVLPPRTGLSTVGEADIPLLEELAKVAYTKTLLPLCLDTLHFHAQCLRNGMDDGRTLFKLEEGGRVVGGCGLHHYIWGPSTICWASWFFLHPGVRQGTTGFKMFRALVAEAVQRGFKRLYVETPSADPDYATICEYLPRVGFQLETELADYYAPGVHLQLFRLDLSPADQ